MALCGKWHCYFQPETLGRVELTKVFFYKEGQVVLHDECLYVITKKKCYLSYNKSDGIINQEGKITNIQCMTLAILSTQF